MPEEAIPRYAETLDKGFNNNRDWMTSITRFFSERLEFQLKVMAHLFYGARVHFFNPIDWVSLTFPATAFVYFIDGRKIALVTASVISLTAVLFTFFIGEETQLTFMWVFLSLSAVGAIYLIIKHEVMSPIIVLGIVSIYAVILNGYKLGPLPWSSIAATAAVLGYYLGGWRLALLGGGTFIWTALIGQWKLAMETLSVLVVAAPVSFVIGLMLGIAAWKFTKFDKFLRPLLSVLQTLPFFTYLLPAVIFFKVGPTAGAMATIIYAIPPMILMTTLGLKKVSPEIVEAGKMAGCSRFQMLSKVYIPAARTELLVGLNQVIMLCLAMVVLTAFIGMPGLGAKLLAMMNSFKLGRSFEIGVTIVLVAVMLDRLSKAWVVKQPVHFERGAPWWERHFFLLAAIVAFFGFMLFSMEVQFADQIGRKQHFSKGKEIDGLIKGFLDIDAVQAVTGWLRWFLITKVLIPFRDLLLWVPTSSFILFITVFSLWLGGKIVIDGDASQYAGATGHGGLLVIKGNASSRCGISMKGINIVVHGNIGHMSAFMAQSGNLVVCGDAGDALGDSCYEARLFVRGSVKSLGADCEEKEMRPEHIKILKELLAEADSDAKPEEFKRYGSARNLYNFDVDNAAAY
ncbi:ABC transporter permease subunit [Amylibacter sp.]|nr:ABC transporter permease subunit [Amylibacter sp.]